MTEESAAHAFMREHLANYETTVKHYPYALPISADAYQNTDQMARAVTASGSPYFSRDTMRWFSSKLYPDMYGGGRLFITSERDEHRTEYHAREYSVRWVYSHGDGGRLSIDRFDTLHSSLDKARRFARTAAGILWPEADV